MFEPPRAMTGFPIVHEHFSVFCFITQRARQPAMIFMGVREDDAANVADIQTRLSQSRAQSLNCFSCFRPGIDNRDRIFLD